MFSRRVAENRPRSHRLIITNKLVRDRYVRCIAIVLGSVTGGLFACFGFSRQHRLLVSSQFLAQSPEHRAGRAENRQQQ